MINIQTLANTNNAVILTLGAIKFNRNIPLPPLEKCDTFYERIYSHSCEAIGLVSDIEKINWWIQRNNSESKYEAIINPLRKNIYFVLKEFKKWVGFSSNYKIWSPRNDYIILENAYNACGLKKPWSFFKTRDTKTLFDIFNRDIDYNSLLNYHSLYDAHNLVLELQKSIIIFDSRCGK